jgi:hypothetical protein
MAALSLSGLGLQRATETTTKRSRIYFMASLTIDMPEHGLVRAFLKMVPLAQRKNKGRSKK